MVALHALAHNLVPFIHQHAQQAALQQPTLSLRYTDDHQNTIWVQTLPGRLHNVTPSVIPHQTPKGPKNLGLFQLLVLLRYLIGCEIEDISMVLPRIFRDLQHCRW